MFVRHEMGLVKLLVVGRAARPTFQFIRVHLCNLWLNSY